MLRVVLPGLAAILAVCVPAGAQTATAGGVATYTAAMTSYPFGVVTDPAGNVYVTGFSGNAVYKGTLSGTTYTYTTLFTGITGASGIARDSSGNFYIGEDTVSALIKETYNSGTNTYTASTIANPGIGNLIGVAVDTTGNVFFGFSYSGSTSSVYELTYNGSTYAQSTVATGFSFVDGISLDGTGNLYVVDNSAGLVYKLLKSNGYARGSALSIHGLSQPEGVVSDGSGNLYITNDGSSNTLIEAVFNGSTYMTKVLATRNGEGLDAFDSQGNVISPNASNQTITKYFPGSAAFPSTPVGTAAAQVPLTFLITGPGTLPALSNANVLTTGSAGLDFTLGTGSTCAGAVTAGNTCTVNVAFTPQAPGVRQGAVVLKNSGGATIATAYVSGVGTGPQAIYTNGSESATASNANVNALTTDAAGNLYYSSLSTSSVYKVAFGTGTVTTLARGLSTPSGVAVDGAGDVFYADYGANRISELVGGTGTPVVVVSSVNAPEGLTVDGSGNLYAAVSGSGYVEEYASGSFAPVATYGSSLSHALGVAITGSGTVFITDFGNGKLVEVASGTQTTIDASLSSPAGLAVDAAGDVYVGSSSSTINRYTAGTFAKTALAATFSSPYYVTLDNSGNLYVAERGTSVIDTFLRTKATAQTFATATMAATTDTTDGTQLFNFENAGNTALTIASIAASNMNFTFAGATSGSNAACGTSLAAGAICGLGATFTPKTAGALTGNGIVTDNSLNAMNATQTVALSGTGTQNTNTTLSLSANPTSANYGSIVTLTATVTSNSGATGTVTFYNGNQILGTGTLTNGVATLASTALPVGVDSVTASYAGDSGDVGATSNAVAVTVTTPATAVGSTSATQMVQFNFTSTVTLNATQATAVQVVTQGLPNLDFKYVSGGACTAGATYSAGQSCTVDFSFSPSAPGTRDGAVVLYNNAATPAVIGATFISGVGTGPLADFSSSTAASAVTSGLTSPQDVTADAAGNLYITSSTFIAKASAGSSAATTYVTSAQFKLLVEVAIDGAGNLYATDYAAGKVFKIVGTSVTQLVTTSLVHPQGIVVDPAGNVFFTDQGTNMLYEVAAGSTSPTVIIPSSGGLNGPTALAVDNAGGLYIADANNNVVKRLAAGATTTTTVATPGYTLSSPEGLAVDAAGDLFINDLGNSRFLKIPAGGGAPYVLGTGSYLFFMSLDSAGRLYVANQNSNQVVRFDRTVASPITFPSTAVGVTSSGQTVAFENDGNAALQIASVTTTTANFSGNLAGCPTSLFAGSSCSLSFSFTPEMAGTLTANGVVTDSSLNVSGAMQLVPLSGVGTQGTKTITFGQPTTPAVAGTSATLTASTSNGDPVVFSITSGTATISGTTTTSGVTTATIVYTNSGTVTIAANSVATPNATLAPTVSRSVTVTAAPTTFAATAELIGVSSGTLTAEVTFTKAGTPTAISVVTNGATGMDFALVPGGNCSTSIAYSVGQSCTVQFSFTPTATGARLGAVLVSNASGLLAQSALNGLGQGPILAFNDTAKVLASPGNNSASFGLSQDGAGNLYYGGANYNVYKLTPGGTQTVFYAYNGSYVPTGTGVDPAGNVYLLSYTTAGSILKLTPAGVLSATITVPSSASTFQIAFGLDGTGYVANYGDGLFTISPAGVATAFPFSGNSTAGAEGVAVDGAGNIYVADTNNDRILKATPSGATTVVASPGYISGLTVDAAGNIYTVSNSNVITRYTPAGVANGPYNFNGTGTAPQYLHGLISDGKGDLFATDYSSGTVYQYTLTANPATAFNAAAVGFTSSDSPKSVSGLNMGNTPLTITGFTAPAGFTVNTASTTCPITGASTLAVEASCVFAMNYQPVALGAATGNFTITDNTLNAPGTTQLLPVTGGAATQGMKTVTFVQPASPATVGTMATLVSTTSDGDPVTYSTGSGSTATATYVGSTVTYVSAGTLNILATSAATATAAVATATRTVTVTNTPPAAPTITAPANGSTTPRAVTITGTAVSTASVAISDNGTVIATVNAAVNGSFSQQYTFALGAHSLTATATFNGATSVASTAVSFTASTQSVFIGSGSGGTVASLNNNGTQQSAATGGGGRGMAVDSGGYVWAVNGNGSGVSRFTDLGAFTVGYSGLGIAAANALAIDGNGVVWIANSGSISALTNGGNAVSTTPVAQAGGLATPNSITVDTAGSLWLANTGNNTVTEVIGAAAPIATPTVKQVISVTPGTRP